jgi:hypothetical protein
MERVNAMGRIDKKRTIYVNYIWYYGSVSLCMISGSYMFDIMAIYRINVYARILFTTIVMTAASYACWEWGCYIAVIALNKICGRRRVILSRAKAIIIFKLGNSN